VKSDKSDPPLESIQPLSDRVLVRRHDPVKKSRLGIILPDNAQQKPDKGTVLAVGPGRTCDDGTLLPMLVKVGDVVLFPHYMGNEVPFLDETLLFIDQPNILGKIVED
jgi:chaperonin GroES